MPCWRFRSGLNRRQTMPRPIITPQETRGALVQAIEMSENVAEIPEYRTGVLQT